jgi:hypothetical protein
MTNSLQNIEKKVIYHNNTGSNDSRNERSIGKKALDQRMLHDQIFMVR